jgi:preprotein translocase subunit YajC
VLVIIGPVVFLLLAAGVYLFVIRPGMRRKKAWIETR